ncbi:hypothetical protein DSL92_08990 [Billgrantia gudaonensis]|uniref:Uncharacterized protein n=1 Tax=Billgrantia gudaonensis TaxID=376427 RepID=A0A3S0NE92_9GAMM|nr:hypothetical protein DSL92_08990 [Halomonas gudaonensis]
MADAERIDWHALLTHDFITLQRPSMVRILLERTLARRGTELRWPSKPSTGHRGTWWPAGSGECRPGSVPGADAGARGVLRPLHDPPIQRTVGIVVSAGQELSVAARAYARCCRDPGHCSPRT